MTRPKAQTYADSEHFGSKLSKLRQAAGYSQRELAKVTGISQRMIAYYEKQPQFPPMHVIAQLSDALGIPAQELLSFKNKKAGAKVKDMRIRKRLEQIDDLEEKEKRQVIQLLDTFIEKNRLKQAMSS
jgi:transcriptional regulator with XRE-family HTH domain